MCPACGEALTVHTGVSFNQASRGENYWNSCLKCGSYFVSQPYNREKEATHSQEMPWGIPKSGKELGELKMRMYRAVLDLLHPYCSPPAQLLDIGCSYGGFLLEARQMGYSVRGLDILAGAVEYVRSLNIPAEISYSIWTASPKSECAYDILTCLDCNYYWPDQRTELQGAYSKLKPGGYLVMRVVDKSWLFRLGITVHALSPKLGKRILAASVNDHRFSMPVQSLLSLLRSCGFEIVYASPEGALHSNRTRWPVKVAFWLGTVAKKLAGVFWAPGALILARKPLQNI